MKKLVLGVCGFLINASALVGLSATSTVEFDTKTVCCSYSINPEIRT